MHHSTNKHTQVMLGLSGGVDSAVCAFLLKQQGYQVHAVFMQNWSMDKEDPFCTAHQDLSDARAICDQLDIPLSIVNFSQEYWDKVFQYCLNEFSAGRTPNPDIGCNQEIKFKAFLNYAEEQGADFIAMGHYAQILKKDQQYFLTRGADFNKDQTYFLYTLNQYQLSKSLFPIGGQQKTEVRKIAQQAGLHNYAKKDSTGICFIGERKFQNFLKSFLLAQPGNIENLAGEILGRHEGVMFYTLGQRKGLNIGGKKESQELPWYVISKDIARNVLIVEQGHNHPALFSKKLICHQVTWIDEKSKQTPFTCSAKIRYRHPDQTCQVSPILSEQVSQYKVEFEQAQWAVTPGQSIVFYENEFCLGGGIIL